MKNNSPAKIKQHQNFLTNFAMFGPCDEGHQWYLANWESVWDDQGNFVLGSAPYIYVKFTLLHGIVDVAAGFNFAKEDVTELVTMCYRNQEILQLIQQQTNDEGLIAKIQEHMQILDQQNAALKNS